MSNGKSVLVAAFVVMGFWGYVHLAGGIIRAVHYHQASQVNPYNLTRLNGPLGHAGQSWWGFTLGWLIFVVMVAGISFYLVRQRR